MGVYKIGGHTNLISQLLATNHNGFSLGELLPLIPTSVSRGNWRMRRDGWRSYATPLEGERRETIFL
jgi:hypothetical protein